ncbi:MAG: hypothetical protein V4665_01840 [Patescibacteria group bacterium]
MEKVNIENSNKNIFNELDSHIEQAVIHAIDFDKLKVLTTQIIELRKSGKDSEQLKSIINELTPCKIECKTLAEFRYILEKLKFLPEQADSFLSHENAHGNMADYLGAKHEGYMFFVYKSGDDIGIHPAAHYSFPEEWASDYKLDVRKKIIQAPELYGHELSKSDKKALEN